MRTPRRLPALASGLALAVTLGLAAPAAAADPVGGPELGSRGLVLPVGAPPVPPEVVAHGWLVADLDTGEVLGARDAHGRYAPASTLKVLTAVALIPRLDPARKVVPSYDDIAVDGSKVGLVERVGYPVDELFAALMMVSGNDVANTLASAAGGPAAIEAMNAEARRLQAHDTRAVNPSGLDADGQTSSAYDLALLARAGMKLDAFRRYVSQLNGSVSGPGGKRIETYNHNKLLRSYDGALGIKNGYTSRAKASFVGAAQRHGRTLVVTMMRTQPRVHLEAALLLDWGFAAAAKGVPPVGQLVDPVEGEPAGDVSGDVPEQQPGQHASGTAVLAAERVGTAAAPQPQDSGGLPVNALVALALAGSLVAMRRRQVVLARRRRARVPIRRR
ncbi:MAG: D-alanyl-D-alanine carboxypeptidase [Frankiales bacterium]|nr:D-alanyl-D-alanine carboxypeptidase [Frankiales bacterium]